ncbi:MAG: type II toxin-antitoxin system VapC family toxin [Gammaproteobacteria bacterium]|nr:type II toxin-antitoxin system VapC family toxin [Gammaproteobacteria bacterium]
MGPDAEWAEAALAPGALAAPELAVAEASNILRRLGRAGEVSRLEATGSHADLLRLDIDLQPYRPFAERIWELRGNLTSYDAWYVAMAEALECPLVTLDRRLARDRASVPHRRSVSLPRRQLRPATRPSSALSDPA